MTQGKIRVLLVNLLLIALVAAAATWGWKSLHPAAVVESAPQTTTVSMGAITASVSASGKVVSPGDIAVAPTVSGTLIAVNVTVGQHVTQGQILAQVDPASQKQALEQAINSQTSAKNALFNAQTALDKLKKVKTADEIKQAELQLASQKANVDSAQQTLDDQTVLLAANVATYQANVDAAKKTLDDTTANQADAAVGYQNSVDAAKTSLDASQTTFDNYSRIFSGLTLEFCNSLSVTSTNCSTYLSNYNSLQSAKNSYNNALLSQKVNLKKDAQTLAGLQVAYQNALTSQTTNLKKDAISLANYKKAVVTAKAAFDLYVTTQAIANAPATQADLDAAQRAIDAAAAGIKSAQASYDTAARNLAGTTVKAPVEGDVASISATVGQNAPTATNKTSGVVSGFIVLTNVSALRVQASFSEADASKIVAGQSTSYSFEAMPTVTATGFVARVDILPTTTNNVVTYTVDMDITGGVPGLKPGMTTTATITTGSVPNALRVTAQAVTTRGTSSTVRLAKTVNGKQTFTATPVVVGLKGDSFVEIQSGVKEGDVVALNAAAQSTISSNGFARGGVPAGIG
ncbi:MAG: HlyD family efflux transporter periplasmic adaptor subunit, partial [Actinobacteria bacterium]|nr:HlyD family efflux transporter periplasmic adaptor subunit [Actinomycetota bacterium]